MRILASLFWSYLHRSDDSVRWRTAAIVALSIGFAAISGSVIAFLLVGLAWFAWVYLLIDRSKLIIVRKDIVIGAIFGLYVLVALAAALAGANPQEAWYSVLYRNSAFLVMLPLAPMLRYFWRPYWEDWFWLGIGWGGVASGVFALLDRGYFGALRVEAMSGNPLVFAYLAGIVSLFNLFLVTDGNARLRWLHVAGFLLGCAAVLLTASRAPIAFTVAGAGIVVLIRMRALLAFVSPKVAGAALLASLVGVGILAASDGGELVGRVETRFERLLNSFAGSNETRMDESLEIRQSMLKAGFAAFLERPFTGYGRQNVVAVADAEFDDDPSFMKFSHLHNAYLTEGVASGVFGVLTLIAVLATPLIAARSASGPWRGIAAITCAYTAVNMTVNIGFYHDIMTFFFCNLVCVAASMDANRHALRDGQRIDTQ